MLIDDNINGVNENELFSKDRCFPANLDAQPPCCYYRYQVLENDGKTTWPEDEFTSSST